MIDCRQQNECDLRIKIGFGRIENIVGKRENAGNTFPAVFLKHLFSQIVIKEGNEWHMVKICPNQKHLHVTKTMCFNDDTVFESFRSNPLLFAI